MYSYAPFTQDTANIELSAVVSLYGANMFLQREVVTSTEKHSGQIQL